MEKHSYGDGYRIHFDESDIIKGSPVEPIHEAEIISTVNSLHRTADGYLDTANELVNDDCPQYLVAEYVKQAKQFFDLAVRLAEFIEPAGSDMLVEEASEYLRSQP